MGDGYEQAERPGQTFALMMPPQGGDVRLAYDGLIRVTEPVAATVRTWTGRLHNLRTDKPNYVQICCKGSCSSCDTKIPCTIIGDPLIEQDHQIEMPARAQLYRRKSSHEPKLADALKLPDTLELPDGKLIAVLSLSSVSLEAQLQRWHNACFVAEREVVYHLYHISAETTPGGRPAGSAFDLVGKVIAIPVEPTPELPASAVDS